MTKIIDSMDILKEVWKERYNDWVGLTVGGVDELTVLLSKNYHHAWTSVISRPGISDDKYFADLLGMLHELSNITDDFFWLCCDDPYTKHLSWDLHHRIIIFTKKEEDSMYIALKYGV